MEIYDGVNIQFMAPLAKQDEFYIPEANSMIFFFMFIYRFIL